MEPINIIISGDFAITEGHKNEIFIEQKILDLFGNSDLNITNLECPITLSGGENKIEKTGPNIKGEKNQIKKVLDKLNISLVTLANNHILDYGESGLKDTLDFCDENKIDYVGAGMNLEDAKKTYTKTINGTIISIVNFAENEWSSAEDKKAGANPMNIIDNVKQIQLAKKTSDIVIVIIHGGHEYYNLPSPRMQKQYRYYSENGADIIVGHHTHCISGYENYFNTPIYYSLGNFLFTMHSKFDDWYTGTVLDIKIQNKKIINSNLIIVNQDKEDFKLKIIDDNELINNRILDYCTTIENKNQIKSSWDNFILSRRSSYNSYYSLLTFISIPIFSSIIKKFRLTSLFKNKNADKLFLNLLRCEAHADLSKEILKSKERK